MKRVLGAIVALAIGLAGLVGTASSAAAYGGYSASASNVYFTSDSCFQGRVTISGFDPSYDADGNDVSVLGPGGAYVDGDFAWGDSSITLRPLLCSWSDPTGRYSVRVDGREVTAFTVARPAIVARNAYLGSRSAQVRARMTLLGHPMANRTVRLERLRYGSWFQVSTRRTNWDGAAAVACPKRGKVCPGLYRFTFNDVAHSNAFHLPKRRR